MISKTMTRKLPFRRRLLLQQKILLALIALTLLYLWTSMYSMNISNYRFLSFEDSMAYDKQPLILQDSRELAILLLDVYQKMEQAIQLKKPPTLKNLKDLKYVASRLYPPVDIDIFAPSAHTTVVCPEQYFGPKATSPGWQTLNCTGVPPIEDIITVLINVLDVVTTEKKGLLMQLLADFFESYPRMHVIAIGSGLSVQELSTVSGFNASLVQFLEPAIDPTRSGAMGKSWNSAIELVNTPFVLIARDVWRFSRLSSPLDRALRVLSEVPGVGAVGGGLRNRNGHWKVGCFQSNLKNYVLRYQEGYRFSKNESMFCDYIDGPFVTYTRLLKQKVLDGQLEPDVLFQDFFLNLSNDWLTMVAPDVMFYASGPMTDASSIVLPSTWQSLARKWELNRIAIDLQSFNVLHKYSCSDVGISCSKKKDATSSYTIPVCCQEEFAAAVAYFNEFCETYNMSCQFDSGSCLGAVKMGDLIPWDIDGDSGYPEQNYSFFKKMAPKFKKRGFPLTSFEDPACCDERTPDGLTRSYFKVIVSGMNFEAWGNWYIPYDTFLFDKSSGLTDTKIEIHGAWVSGPPNPGHYARKRYGPECLRHAQSWRHTGQNTAWAPYTAGHFNRCKKKGHQACLDRLPVDGNIEFLVPE